jgi:hypothetical protein
MSRFRLYGSGGRPVYDSAGEPTDQRLDRIKREFNAGVALFHDPAARLVRMQVKIHRRSPEQFVATYQTDDEENLLEGLVDRVRRLVDDREWTIQHGIGGNQALFDAVSDGSAFDPEGIAAVESDLSAQSIDPDTIRSAVADAGAVDLLVPDYESAAAAFAYVRETFEEYAVAVTESTDVETIASADVFVRPSREVDRVTPGPEFAAWIDRRRTEAAVDEFERAVEAFATWIENEEESDATESIAAAFDRTDVASALGVRVVPSGESSLGRREFRQTLLYGLPGIVVLAVAAGASQVGLVPDSVPVLAGSYGPLAVALVGVLWLGAVFAVRTTHGGREDRERYASGATVTGEARERADAALGALDRIETVAGGRTAREVLADAVSPHGVAVEPDSERRNRRQRATVAAVAVSAAVGVVAFAVVAFGAPALG